MRASPLSRFATHLVLLLLVASLSGCAFFNRGKKADVLDTLPVEQVYQLGVDALDENRYDYATRAFSRLIARFPFGEYTEQAQINLAYAQFKDGKPAESYSTINRFIRTYPTHKHIDYAFYLRGLINFNRSGGFLERYLGLDMSQRDQAMVRESFDDFGALVSRYPNSRYAPDARQRMVYLRNMMANRELNIALYYFKRDHFVASANRAKALIETYPESPQVADGLAVLMLSHQSLGQESMAADTRRVLELNDPQHPALHGTWPKYPSNLWKLVPLSNR